MPKKKGDQQVGITKDKLLMLLERSGRPNFTKRRLTQFTSKGLLPSLKHTTHIGSNRPVYVWEQGVIKQAIDLYDVIERGYGQYHQLFLALWLRGYEVPFAPLLQRWVRLIETILYNVAKGEHDPDAILDHITDTVVEYLEPKWRFSPRPDHVIREVGVDTWGELMEFLLALFVIPTYEPEEMSCEKQLTTLQHLHKIAQADVHRGDAPSSQASRTAAEEMLSWLLSYRDVLTLPRLRDTLINASAERWARARNDYLVLCRMLHDLAELFPRRNARMTPQMREGMFLYYGFLLPPLFLSLRDCGYGDQMSEMLTGLNDLLNDLLADPDLRTLLAKM